MLDADQIDRTVLLAVHDGRAATLEEAQAAHEATGIIVVADDHVCHSVCGQAALLTATHAKGGLAQRVAVGGWHGPSQFGPFYP